jgi:hypothetical protein
MEPIQAEKVSSKQKRLEEKAAKVEAILEESPLSGDFPIFKAKRMPLMEDFIIAMRKAAASAKRELQIKNLANPLVFEFVIHYPDIVITNTAKKTRPIKDLFVSFDMLYIPEDIPQKSPETIRIIDSLKGMRTTFYRDDLRNQYSHSHLPSLHYTPSHFCLGTGPLSSMAIDGRNLTRKFFEGKDMNLYAKAWFYNLEEYVKWESIEGRPYRRIGDLRATSVEITENSAANYRISWIDNVMEYLKKNPTEVSFRLNNGKIEIGLTANVMNFCIQLGVPKVLKATNGKFYKEDDGGNSISFEKELARTKPFSFNGKLIPFKVLEDETQQFEKQPYVHPAFLLHLRETIKNKLNNEFAKIYNSIQFEN